MDIVKHDIAKPRVLYSECEICHKPIFDSQCHRTEPLPAHSKCDEKRLRKEIESLRDQLAIKDGELRKAEERERIKDDWIDRLRGHLQNCVNNLDRANRQYPGGKFDSVIASSNKALYESMHIDDKQVIEQADNE